MPSSRLLIGRGGETYNCAPPRLVISFFFSSFPPSFRVRGGACPVSPRGLGCLLSCCPRACVVPWGVLRPRLARAVMGSWRAALRGLVAPPHGRAGSRRAWCALSPWVSRVPPRAAALAGGSVAPPRATRALPSGVYVPVPHCRHRPFVACYRVLRQAVASMR